MAVALEPEKLLVSKIIQEHSFAEVADIQTHFFSPGAYREAFQYIKDYFADHGEVPAKRVISNDLPMLKLIEVDVPWSDLLKRVTDKYLISVVDGQLDKAAQAMEDGDLDGVVNLLGSLVGKIHNEVPTSRDVDVTQNGDERLAEYLDRKNNPQAIVGITSGFPSIDRATQGFRDGQLITLTGLPKSSKSVLAILFGMAAQEAGKKVLYITYEMTCEEIYERIDAYRAGINDMKLLSGNLTDEEYAKLRKAVHQSENLPAMIISQDCMTVSAVGAKIDLHKPDLVIIDGTYMMEDEEGYDKNTSFALANIVSGLKSMAMNRDKPIIAVTQSNPDRAKGGKLNEDSIAGSRAFIQYSNVVLGVERTDDMKVRKLKSIMVRRGVATECAVLMDFDNGRFEELEGVELDDDMDRELDDDEETEFSGNY